MFYHKNSVSQYNFVEEIYRKELKTIFFSGFLTLGSFLFAMKSFTLINFKKEIYDSPTYQSDFMMDISKYNLDPSRFLEPLKNLSNLMFLAIFSSILTSIAQVSLGMLHNFNLILICISMAAFSLSIVILALYWLKRNINVWVTHLEKDDYKKILSTPQTNARSLIPSEHSEKKQSDDSIPS
jgi:Na+/proline symporter